MAKPKRRRRRDSHGYHEPTASSPAAGQSVSTGAYVCGILLLAVCILTSLMLALEHLGGLALPGCGEGSSCAEAVASVWGTIPYVDWPVSFLGLAYFLGLLASWLTARRGIPVAVRHLVRLGVLISLAFLVIMVVERHVCHYCLATHVANFAFWILVERAAGAPAGTTRALTTIASVFVICSGVLGVLEWRWQRAAMAMAEEQLANSTAAIIASASRPAEPRADAAEPVASAVEARTEAEPRVSGSAEAATAPAGAASAPVAPATQPAKPVAGLKEEPGEPVVAPQPSLGTQGFAGRYRRGPAKAAIRVVSISDYQCPICRRIESDVERVFEQRDDMSISFKHYPMNSDCNRKVRRSRHPNACWAARAAEAAGILRGNEGFWQMHSWLFEHGGSFNYGELQIALRQFGYDVAEFTRIMKSEETLALVRADVEEAISLGIYQTPTVFINGVELRGWNAPRAIERAIERLAATQPEPMTASHDHPPLALEKLIGDWQSQRRVRIGSTAAFRALGPEDARVRVVVFGDFQQDGTAETDAVLRRELASRDDLRYEFRYFPFNKDCNPELKVETRFPHACRAALAAEAAGRLGGSEGYWKMHKWLLENQETFSEAALKEAAAGMGIDADLLLTQMEKPDLHAIVVEDAKLGQRCGVTAVPSVFVNERRVPRWVLEGENILPHIITEAAKE
jgi:protein-disulfide isomerase/uncharacterized membrane protein